MQAKSPREMLNLPEEPSKSDMPITTSEAKAISKSIGKTVSTGNGGKLTKTAKKLAVAVKSKLSNSLEEAGVTKKKIAETIAGALDATTLVKVGEEEYDERPDHRIRLSAVAIVKDLMLESERSEDTREEDKGFAFEALADMTLEEIQSMRVTIRTKKRQSRTVPPVVERMMLDGQQ